MAGTGGLAAFGSRSGVLAEEGAPIRDKDGKPEKEEEEERGGDKQRLKDGELPKVEARHRKSMGQMGWKREVGRGAIPQHEHRFVSRENLLQENLQLSLHYFQLKLVGLRLFQYLHL